MLFRLMCAVLWRAVTGTEVSTRTPEEVTRRISSDLAKWKKVQRRTGIRGD